MTRTASNHSLLALDFVAPLEERDQLLYLEVLNVPDFDDGGVRLEAVVPHLPLYQRCVLVQVLAHRDDVQNPIDLVPEEEVPELLSFQKLPADWMQTDFAFLLLGPVLLFDGGFANVGLLDQLSFSLLWFGFLLVLAVFLGDLLDDF